MIQKQQQQEKEDDIKLMNFEIKFFINNKCKSVNFIIIFFLKKSKEHVLKEKHHLTDVLLYYINLIIF